MAGVDPASIDLLIVATVTPDMAFPSTSALLADELGMPDAAAYDLSAGCTGFVYAIAQAYAMLAAGLAKRALVVGGDVLSKILDWTDRSTRRALRRRRRRGRDGARSTRAASSASSSARTAAAARTCWLPGQRLAAVRRAGAGSCKMNGREVFKFATRVMVSSAEAILAECGKTVDDVDVYVPHQANVRIIDHAVRRSSGSRRRRPS